MFQPLSKDQNTNESEVINAGHKLLSSKDLVSKIANKTIWGIYLHGFIYTSNIKSNGTMEGVNNVGSHNLGEWLVNEEDNTFTVKWNNGWDHTTTRAYELNGEIKFYDSGTGMWRTTFQKIK